MRVTGKNSISAYIEVILKIIFLLGILGIIFLPIFVRYYMDFLELNISNLYLSFLVILYTSGLPALIIVYQFIKLFGTLKLNTPFIIENAKHLKIASICCSVIALEYVIGIYIFQSVFTGIIASVFCIAWIGLYILSELFKQAVEFKEENELTI